jgi:hypothetical protein
MIGRGSSSATKARWLEGFTTGGSIHGPDSTFHTWIPVSSSSRDLFFLSLAVIGSSIKLLYINQFT